LGNLQIYCCIIYILYTDIHDMCISNLFCIYEADSICNIHNEEWFWANYRDQPPHFSSFDVPLNKSIDYHWLDHVCFISRVCIHSYYSVYITYIYIFITYIYIIHYNIYRY
jgi:hypothetical protein